MCVYMGYICSGVDLLVVLSQAQQQLVVKSLEI